jgi:hypothetical protein
MPPEKASNRNYHEVTIPEDKPKDEWTSTQRRAWIYQKKLVDENKIYSEVSRTEVGDKFDVHHTTITNDIKVLKEFVANNIGDDFEAELELMQRNALRELFKRENYSKLIDKSTTYSQWLEARGVVENEREENVNLFSEDISIESTVIDDRDSDDV